MIKNYIFDFGNVLGEFYPERLTAPYVEDAEAQSIISEVAFDRLYWDALDRGAITDAEVKADMCRRLPQPLAQQACTVYDCWVKTMTPVPGMQKLIADIKKTDKKLYLLSNISQGFADTYKEVEWINALLSGFDGLVLSGTIRLAKPSKEIFEYVLNTFSLNAEESLFIDDSIKNIEGAKKVGINGYLFDGDVQKLRTYLGL